MSAFWHLLKAVIVQPAAVVSAAIGLANCSALPPDYTATPVMPGTYGALVAESIKAYSSSYTDFEISEPRWVHATTGWNWLVCLRYNDHGHRRYYSFFIAGNKVVNARYDTVTDRCGAQQYAPFDVTTGAIGAVAAPTQQISPPVQPPIY